MYFIVWHDNGVSGQYGYTEEEAENAEQLQKEYEDSGAIVYEIRAL